jgi:hypothetical protein
MTYDPSNQPRPFHQPESFPPNHTPNKSKTPLFIGVFVLGMLIACVGGLVLANGSDDIKSGVRAATSVGVVTPSPIGPPPTSVAPKAIPSKTSTPTKTKAAPPSVNDGMWLVGDDIPAGKYRVSVPVNSTDMCYWAKLSDAESSDIIANDLPQGGRPMVTLKKGQWFETQRCGTWVKQ